MVGPKRVSVSDLTGNNEDHGWQYVEIADPSQNDYSQYGDDPKDRDEDYYDPDDPETW